MDDVLQVSLSNIFLSTLALLLVWSFLNYFPNIILYFLKGRRLHEADSFQIHQSIKNACFFIGVGVPKIYWSSECTGKGFCFSGFWRNRRHYLIVSEEVLNLGKTEDDLEEISLHHALSLKHDHLKIRSLLLFKLLFFRKVLCIGRRPVRSIVLKEDNLKKREKMDRSWSFHLHVLLRYTRMIISMFRTYLFLPIDLMVMQFFLFLSNKAKIQKEIYKIYPLRSKRFLLINRIRPLQNRSGPYAIHFLETE